jgi:hypothetical protein
VTDAGALSILPFALCGQPIPDPVTASESAATRIEARASQLSTPADAGADAGEDLKALDAFGTWSSLYNDYFGPTGRPGSCSLALNCHGPDPKTKADKGSGYNAPAGIHCDDPKTCWCSISGDDPSGAPLADCPKDGHRNLARPKDQKNPSQAPFFSVVRHCKEDGTSVGIMPFQPIASFSNYAFARMKLWVARGSPND